MSAEELDEDGAITTLDEFVVNSGGERKIKVDINGKQRTVDPRPIYTFERELADDIIESSLSSDVRGAAVPIKGRWIHGWLNHKGEDYINNTWHGYQYFLKYVQAVTSSFENISTYQRSPGTYDSMYRYILVLEDLELVERYRRESVDADEYDFNVPEEFRTRTFLRITASYEGNERLWDNPIGIVYGDADVESLDETDDTEDEQQAETTTEPGDLDEFVPEEEQPANLPETTGSLEGFRPDSDQEIDTGPEPEPDEFSDDENKTLPPEKASIVDFDGLDDIPKFVEKWFPEAVQEAFNRSPVPIDEPTPEDIELGRIAITGPWAATNATPGSTHLNIFIEVINDSNSMNPGFLTGSINSILAEKLESNNVFSDTFPGYNIFSSYSSSYRSQLKKHVTRNESSNKLYSFDKEEIEEV